MNIQQKRTKGAVTSHTELSWTMPEMRTRDGKHSTSLGNSLFIFLNIFIPGSTPFWQLHWIISVTLLSLGWLATWALSPFFAMAEQDSSQEQLTPASGLKKSLLTFLQTQLISVLAIKRLKVQDCGLVDCLSPTKVAHFDCFVTLSKDFFSKIISFQSQSLYCCRGAKQNKFLPLCLRGHEPNREIHTKSTGNTRAAKDAEMTSVEGEQRDMYYLGRMPNADKRLHRTPFLSGRNHSSLF